MWGPVAMPARPALTDEQAAAMVSYVRSLADTTTRARPVPVRGSYMPAAGSADAPHGELVLRAVYTDRGANGMPPITSEKALVLESPSVVMASGEMGEGVSKQTDDRVPVPVAVVSRSGSSVALKQIDLTGVGSVTLMAVAPTQYQAKGGKIDVHLDTPTGALLGTSQPIQPTGDLSPVPLHVPLQATAGMHDVYFVFSNPDAKGDGFIFGVLTATFEAARPRR